MAIAAGPQVAAALAEAVDLVESSLVVGIEVMLGLGDVGLVEVRFKLPVGSAWVGGGVLGGIGGLGLSVMGGWRNCVSRVIRSHRGSFGVVSVGVWS